MKTYTKPQTAITRMDTQFLMAGSKTPGAGDIGGKTPGIGSRRQDATWSDDEELYEEPE